MRGAGGGAVLDCLARIPAWRVVSWVRTTAATISCERGGRGRAGNSGEGAAALSSRLGSGAGGRRAAAGTRSRARVSAARHTTNRTWRLPSERSSCTSSSWEHCCRKAMSLSYSAGQTRASAWAGLEQVTGVRAPRWARHWRSKDAKGRPEDELRLMSTSGSESAMPPLDCLGCSLT